MTTRLVSSALLTLLVTGPSVAPVAAQPTGPVRPIPGGPKVLLPDLVVRSFKLKTLGSCTPDKPFLVFEVTFVNVGAGPAPHQQEALAWVELVGGTSIAGAGTHGPLGPGKASTGTATFFYQPPKLPPGPPPWTFRAVADPYKVVVESNEGNNVSTPVTISQDPCKK